jgi:hypothetical protein
MLFPLWSGSPHRATKDMDLLGAGSPDIALTELLSSGDAARRRSFDGHLEGDQTAPVAR